MKSIRLQLLAVALIVPLVAAACAPIAPATTSCASLGGSNPTQSIGATPAQSIPTFGYQVINAYPHDPTAFTEGLELNGGELYESTGLNGQSTLRREDLTSGQVQQSLALALEYFGEGITLWKDRIIQLTWQSHVGFVYDKATFQLLKQFNYPTEGWGLTHDDQNLIMSDGTSTLHYLDPDTLQEVKRLDVHDDQGPVLNLNELEYICGEIFANIWQTDRIARISPETGQVVGWIDLTGLLGPEDRIRPVDVLNGIAYDAANDRLYVTGKLWPKLFEIKLIPQP
jgi:glutamine cyclotransferase